MEKGARESVCFRLNTFDQVKMTSAEGENGTLFQVQCRRSTGINKLVGQSSAHSQNQCSGFRIVKTWKMLLNEIERKILFSIWWVLLSKTKLAWSSGCQGLKWELETQESYPPHFLNNEVCTFPNSKPLLPLSNNGDLYIFPSDNLSSSFPP